MPETPPLVSVMAAEAPLRTKASNYPEVFARLMAGREKRPLGELFGLRNFGVNHVRLPPGAVSAQRHAHTRQDEFILVLSGTPTLETDEGARLLQPGECAGFAAGSGNAHRLVNRSQQDATYIEIGDRTPGDTATYPDDDLEAVLGADGRWRFQHKDGSPY